MNTEPQASAATEPAPIGQVTTQFTNEVRYAVVMYGGVSLCIYINGVAQELLELARATAPDAKESRTFWTNEDLSESAKIYRRLGQYLDSDGLDSHLLRRDSAAPIRTRFVVDVLSGTSAGGLNSIFLAKALANNQDMKGLKELWMTEGDISLLLNDARSVKDEPGLAFPSRPTSLLNSQRMYDKLLSALHGMDFPNEPKSGPADPATLREQERQQKQPPSSPLVGELDLYVTATDLRGLPVHIKLDNTVADELRHRNVFRFRYGSAGSDFGSNFNPLLAFAGRCTSSIPPAFEPMRLADIEPVLKTWPRYRALIGDGREDWARFYSDYAKTAETGDFWERDFGDGGFLDNKPFSYATGALMRRQADRPVARKLLYVEPNPEPLRADTASAEKKPNALKHSLAALIGLPRYETIREDLETVLDRNRLLARIDEVTRDVDRDVERGLVPGEEENSDVKVAPKQTRAEKAKQFVATPLAAMIRERGISYGIYHRLKVAETTGELSSLVSELLGYPQAADECVAVGKLLEQWRHRWYAEDPPRMEGRAPSRPVNRRHGGDPSESPPGPIVISSGAEPTEVLASDDWPKTEGQFLLDFDPGYRLRRLFFIHRKITYFYRFAPGSVEEKERADQIDAGLPDPLPKEIARLLKDAESWSRFREALLEIKPRLAKALLELRRVGRRIRDDKDILAKLKTALPREDVERCLREPDQISEIINAPGRQAALEEVSGLIAGAYRDVFTDVAGISEEALAEVRPETSAADPRSATAEAKIARTVLRRIYENFDRYDMAIFPLQYGTNSSGTPHIDILRVSPGDAKNLCANQKGRRKLAGTEFFSFGAFFAHVWRKNDMLWGRLDGAEILVRNLLAKSPAHDKFGAADPAFSDHPGLKNEADRRKRTVADLLIDDLHTAILSDHLRGAQRAEVWALLQRLGPRSERDQLDARVADFVGDSEQFNGAMQRLIDFCKSDEQLLRHYKESYAVNRELDRGDLLKVVSRATKIFGKMLQNVAAESGTAGQQIPALMLRMAAVFSGVLELALPRSPAELLWRYWRSLLYVMGAALFLVGFLFNAHAVQKGGLLIVITTAVVHVVTAGLEMWITRHARNSTRLFAGVISLAVAGIFFLGAWRAVELARPMAAGAAEWMRTHAPFR